MPQPAARNTGRWIAITAAIACLAFFVLVDRIPQDPAYHEFADNRTLVGVPNFWNVATNLAFLLVGAYGLVFVQRNPRVVGDDSLRWPWTVLFAGLVLTAVGSAYYHVVPGNGSLVWDRLPMTLGFAGFFTVVIGEYLSLSAARFLLVPMVLAGVASVVYWYATETAGAGDLRPYAVVAILPLMLTPVILVARRDSSDLTAAIWTMIGFYAVAKLCEHFDTAVFETLGFISGHSLKHVFAALSSGALIYALHQRRGAFRNIARA